MLPVHDANIVLTNRSKGYGPVPISACWPTSQARSTDERLLIHLKQGRVRQYSLLPLPVSFSGICLSGRMPAPASRGALWFVCPDGQKEPVPTKSLLFNQGMKTLADTIQHSGWCPYRSLCGLGGKAGLARRRSVPCRSHSPCCSCTTVSRLRRRPGGVSVVRCAAPCPGRSSQNIDAASVPLGN